MIKFPKMHIAASTVNRILNLGDDLTAAELARAPEARMPDLPDTEMQSEALDLKLALPVSQELPGIDQAPDPGATAAGDSLLKTMLKPGT